MASRLTSLTLLLLLLLAGVSGPFEGTWGGGGGRGLRFNRSRPGERRELLLASASVVLALGFGESEAGARF